MNTKLNETVDRHVQELRQLAADGLITDDDHDMVGCIIRDHIGHLIGVSVIAWDAFKRIIDESREVHYANTGTKSR